MDAYTKELERLKNPDDPKIEHSQAMNDLIDKYFNYDGDQNILESLLVDDSLRDIIPINTLESARDLSELKSDVHIMMKQTFSNGAQYQSLDIIKILLGLNTDKISIKHYGDNPFYGKYKDFDYQSLITHVEDIFRENIADVDYESRRVKYD